MHQPVLADIQVPRPRPAPPVIRPALRNRFLNIYRRQRLRCEVISPGQVEAVATMPNQDGWAISTDLRDALAQLPVRQRKAVLLVGADGLSLADAAAACKCEIGTIKSRVSRARDRLASLLSDEAPAGSGRRANRKPLTRRGSDRPRSDRAAGRPRHSPVASAIQS